MNDPLAWLHDELAQLDADHLRRRLAIRGGPQGPRVVLDGRNFVNFASNDYLNLAADRRLVDAATAAVRGCGWGSGASPLISGRAAVHAELERNLAAWKHAEAALLFTSGYAANVGTIAALAGRGDRIFSDAKNHASIIDGCRLSRADVTVYRHCDVDSLDRLLHEANDASRRRLIVTESVFSMDGDLAPLAAIAELAEATDSVLVVDEAHASGVFGPEGSGLCSALGITDRVPVRIGTLSKAFASSGGYVVGGRHLIDWLLNRARSYVFSTAPPAASAAAALAALRVMRSEPARREGLLELAAWFRGRLAEAGWDIGTSGSQIVPIRVGTPEVALELAARLRSAGMLVPPIRPPTVPPGECLLRVSLTSGHDRSILEQLLEILGPDGGGDL